MQSINPFFAEVLAEMDSLGTESCSLVSSLNLLASFYGLTINAGAKDEVDRLIVDHKLLLVPMLPAPLNDIKNMLLPVLLREKESGHFHVMINQKLMSGSGQHDRLTENRLAKLDFDKVWQCTPIGLPVYGGWFSIFKGAYCLFKREIITNKLLGLFVAILSLLTSLVSGYLFSHIALIANDHWAIWLSFLIAFFVMNFFHYLNELNLKNINLKLLLYILPGVWFYLLSLPLSTIKTYQSGDLAQKLFDYETALSTVLSVMLSLSFSGLALLCLLAYMLYCQFILALIFFIICSMMLVFKLYFTPQTIRFMGKMLAQQSRLTQFLNEALLQIHKVRSAGVENEVFQRWLKILLQAKSLAEQSLQVELISTLLEACVPILLMLSVYFILYWLPGRADTYTLLQFMICAGQFTALFDKLSSQVVSLSHLLPGLSRLQQVMAEPVENRTGTTMITTPLAGDIQFDRVSLRHPSSEQWLLHNISLHIPAGKFIGLVGPSGAGKSTLLKLLLGFVKPDSGVIKVDGLPLSSYSINDLRRQMGVVMQSTSIFPGSIYSNLAINAELCHDEAWRLARLVGLDKEIAAMPMKMHTYISDNAGESLSGGQKQKILIARALAAKPKILLLDEATSALDSTSQAWIFSHLKKLNITRIVIAHRFSTVAAADAVYTLEHGRLVSCAI